MKNLALLTVIVLLSFGVLAQHAIIPQPVSYAEGQGSFSLEGPVYISGNSLDDQGREAMTRLDNYLKRQGIQSQRGTGENNIQLSMLKRKDENLGKEGYKLIVGEQMILLMANEFAGVVNGIATLKQMIPVSGKKEIAACEINDYPRFGWRGLMLDVSRHFFTVNEVKAYIDKMADYKFNIFHWHLTDDEGWRIEIKSLPKLTEVGAWRVERYGRFGDTRPYPEDGEKATYGGFYTQEQIKDVVAYAAARNITIVPEIDMPGHSMAVLAAYPELSVGKEPKFVNPGSKFSEWPGDGTFKMLIENTLNPTDEAVYDFVDKVFTEVAQLFPGQYIHMGADECYMGYWEEDEGVKKFMKKNKLKDGHELQSYFVKRVNQIIQSKGKKMIGWDEILYGGLAEGATVMSWRSEKGAIEAAKKGSYAVMSPVGYCYLDYTQGDHSLENRIYADLSLEKTYEFEPVPEGTDEKYILGGQGNLWTEVIPSLQYAYYMTYPRAMAIAEAVWSPKDTSNWANFVGRVEDHFRRFESENINISTAVYEPIVKVSKDGKKVMCELTNNVPGVEVFYSIDNTYPVKFAKRYDGPFEVPAGNLSLRTQSYRDGKPLGREIIIHRDELVKRIR